MLRSWTSRPVNKQTCAGRFFSREMPFGFFRGTGGEIPIGEFDAGCNATLPLFSWLVPFQVGHAS
jgi:hypothetical protein